MSGENDGPAIPHFPYFWQLCLSYGNDRQVSYHETKAKDEDTAVKTSSPSAADMFPYLFVLQNSSIICTNMLISLDKYATWENVLNKGGQPNSCIKNTCFSIF